MLVRISHLSVEYFDKEFLNQIEGLVGKVARIDDNTTMVAQRGQFTRLSVELDLSKRLLSKFWLKGRIWRIQYEGLRMFCFYYGEIGHLAENCQHDSMEEMDMILQHENRNIAVPNQEIEDNNFGSWMLVKKPPRRRYVKQDKQPVEGGGKHQVHANAPGAIVGQPQAQTRQKDLVMGVKIQYFR